MKVTLVNPSFLDYTVPVYAELDQLLEGKLTVIYSKRRTPDRVVKKIETFLGGRAVGLTGEKILRLGKKNSEFANSAIAIPCQHGLLKTVSSKKSDVVITEGFFQWSYAALWLRVLKKIPCVMCYERTAHTERNAQTYRIAYRKFVMRWIDAVCCSGRLCGEYVQSLGFPAEKITYGYMVADTTGLQNSIAKVTDKQIFELKTKYDLKGIVFLYVGKLIHLKGLIELLNAWKKFSSCISADEATLFLIGDGPQRRELAQYIKKNRLDNVRFAGFVDYDSLASYYKAADAFIIATLEDNWSLVVPEAMACGLPILCSKYNGCWPELVRPGRNGWVFDPLDCKDILQCLKECIENKDHLSQMGERSKVIVSNHTPLKAAESILHACRIAVTGSRYRQRQSYGPFKKYFFSKMR